MFLMNKNKINYNVNKKKNKNIFIEKYNFHIKILNF